MGSDSQRVITKRLEGFDTKCFVNSFSFCFPLLSIDDTSATEFLYKTHGMFDVTKLQGCRQMICSGNP